MKFRLLLLPVFFLSSITVVFPRGGDIGAGKGGSTGGLGISERMFCSFNFMLDVYIIDAKTGVEIGILSSDELDDAIEMLPNGKYLLIYTDSNGIVTQEDYLLKE